MKMRVSFSDLSTFGRCAYKYFLRAHAKLQRKQKNPNLFKGTQTHEGLRVFFLALRDGRTVPEAQDEMFQYFADELEALPKRNPTLFDEELLHLGDIIVEAEDLCVAYIQRNLDEIRTWEILHVEEEFTIELPSGDEITFTPDLIIRDRNGFIWIIDHKTTSRLPEQADVPFADLQEVLYFYGVQLVYGEAVRGFIFNYLRKKQPTMPRLNATHNKESKAFGHYFVNNLKSIDTTYEMLRDFLTAEAPVLLGEPAHQQRLAELRDHNRFFWQERLLVTEEMTKAIMQNVTDTMYLMEVCTEDNAFPKTILNDLAGPMACSRCTFSRICHTELLGWNTVQVIEEDYEPRDPKNPYESEGDDDETD